MNIPCMFDSIVILYDCRSSSISGHPSKYNFAAHMGQLVRGVEGHGCHQFYPECPFSNQMLMEIAKRINFK